MTEWTWHRWPMLARLNRSIQRRPTLLHLLSSPIAPYTRLLVSDPSSQLDKFSLSHSFFKTSLHLEFPVESLQFEPSSPLNSESGLPATTKALGAFARQGPTFTRASMTTAVADVPSTFVDLQKAKELPPGQQNSREVSSFHLLHASQAGYVERVTRHRECVWGKKAIFRMCSKALKI